MLNDSPDNKELEKIVRSYDDPRIVYVENEKNLGISASRNKLIDLARGEYLAVFDHDDISFPTRLEKQAAYLDENPGVGVLGTQVEAPESLKGCDWWLITPADNLDIKRELMRYTAVVHTSAMIRKSVLVESGVRYEEEYSPAEDYLLLVRLIGHTMFHNLPDKLVYYRWHADNTSNRVRERHLDVGALARNIAWREYPYLVSLNASARPPETPPQLAPKKKEWLRLFFIIPFIKIKRKPDGRTKYYLFGFLPLISRR